MKGKDTSARQGPSDFSRDHTGSRIDPGPASSEVTLTLGGLSSFKTRQIYQSGKHGVNAPSGIDIDCSMKRDAIETLHGGDAGPSTPIDIAPTLVDSGQALGFASSFSVVLCDVDGDLDMLEGTDTQGTKVWLNK